MNGDFEQRLGANLERIGQGIYDHPLSQKIREGLDLAKRHPIGTTLAIITLFGVAEVAYLQAKSAEYAKLLTSFTSVDQRLEQLQQDLDQAPLQPDRRDTEQDEPFLTDTKLIRIYMNEYIKHDLGARNKNFEKLWEVIPTEPVQILVTEKQGIWVRDFPDEKLGRKIPTRGPGSGPTYKALSPDLQTPLSGVFQSFVVTKDQLTQQVTIWAVRWSSEGGWEQDKQPHPEFFAVYSNGEWLTRFITEYSALWGTTTSGKEFFKGNLPRNLFLTPENERTSVIL